MRQNRSRFTIDLLITAALWLFALAAAHRLDLIERISAAERYERWQADETVLILLLLQLALAYFVWRRWLVLRHDVAALERAEAELRESEGRFRALTEATFEAITITERSTVVEANSAMAKLFGYEPEELVGMDGLELVAPESRELVKANMLAGYERPYEAIGLSKDGTTFWMEVNDKESWYKGRAVRITAVQNISERKVAEEELRRSEERFRATFDQAPVGIAHTSPDGRWLLVNQKLRNLLGYTRAELNEKTFEEVTHPDDRLTDNELTRRLLAGELEHFTMEKRYIRKDGSEVWVDLTVSLVRTAAGQPDYFIAVVEDITERKALEARLEHQAFHDSLTGLPNRALFANRLRQALAPANPSGPQPLAVLFLDLDGFKHVNDSLGHEFGDRLLSAVAGRIRACVRHDDTVARLGGDEFAVLMQGIMDISNATRTAARIAEQLETRFSVLSHEISIGVSIGIALGVPGLAEPSDLLRQADIAMYHAKHTGKGHYEVFDPGMGEDAAKRFDLKADLQPSTLRNANGGTILRLRCRL